MGHLLLTGVAGYLADEVRRLAVGEEITIGRSRDCGLSLRRAPKWLATGGDEARAAPGYRGVSRTHARVAVTAPGQVEITGLGANGTFVDGVRIDTVRLTDLAARAHELRLGPAEKIRLEWVEA